MLTPLHSAFPASSPSGIEVNIAGGFLSSKAFNCCATACQTNNAKPTWVLSGGCCVASIGSTGPVCISYSLMGNRGLEKDPCMKTHKKHYKEFKKFSKLLIIENVSEYSVPLVEEELGELWTLKVTRLDPRLFGLPVARARLYIIAFRNDELQWVSDLTLDDFVAMLSSECVMSARNLFWMTTQEKELTTAEVTKLQYSCVSDLEDPGKNRYLQNFLCPQFRGISCIPRFQNPVQESFIEIEFIFIHIQHSFEPIHRAGALVDTDVSWSLRPKI